MGGQALRTYVRRMDKSTWESIGKELIPLLEPCYGRVKVPHPQPGKQTFGDLDILCETTSSNTFDPRSVGTKETLRNGHCVTFEYKGHQVDLLHTSTENWDCASFFYDYGDIGMTIGVICKTCGLSFGDRGLVYKTQDFHLNLTKNLSEILRFLGLNKERYDAGFENEEDAFRWIASCKFFRPSMFRRRDEGDLSKKEMTRPMFHHFIEYANTMKFNDEDDRVDKETVIEEAITFFGKTEERDALNEALRRRQVIKEKFNGNLMKAWTGFQGKNLGDFMKKLAEDIGESNLYEMTVDDLKSHVDNIMKDRDVKVLTCSSEELEMILGAIEDLTMNVDDPEDAQSAYALLYKLKAQL